MLVEDPVLMLVVLVEGIEVVGILVVDDVLGEMLASKVQTKNMTNDGWVHLEILTPTC